jgi:hypothetical protein
MILVILRMLGMAGAVGCVVLTCSYTVKRYKRLKVLRDVRREPRESDEYPDLDGLLGGYFHQDFDLAGSNLQEIIATYRAEITDEMRMSTRVDIERFLQKYGPEERNVSEALERVFKPGVIVEGWEELNAKQWLERIADLLA